MSAVPENNAAYWTKRANEVRAARQKEIDEYLELIKRDDFYISFQRYTDGQKEQIARKSITELRQMVIEENIKIVDLLTIMLERAYTVGIKLNALADINTKYAISVALEMEKKLNSTPKAERDTKLGLLFGVPISIKDSIITKGYLSTLGVTCYANQREEKGGLVDHLVLKHGGIPFVKTNIPMFLKTAETVNHMYGRAQNPFNPLRTSGGSSGGESALIASFGSPGGIGGDIGGSIRGPCACTGLWGIKPTAERISVLGSKKSTESKERFPQTGILPVLGPMTRTVDDGIRIFKVLVDEDMKKFDSLIHYNPWNEAMFNNKKKLRIGVIRNGDFFPISAAVNRALHEAVEIAEKIGYEVIHIDVNVTLIFNACIKVLASGNFVKNILAGLKGENPIDEYKLFVLKEKTPSWIVTAIGWLKNKDPTRFFELLKYANNSSMKDSVIGYDMIEDERDKMEKLMIDNKIDGLLAPTQAVPALLHGHGTHLIHAASYNMIFNVLNYPSATMPITIVRPDEQHYKNVGKFDDEIRALTEKTMENSAGLPLGVQIACRPFHEELVFHIMKQFEKHLSPTEFPYLK